MIRRTALGLLAGLAAIALPATAGAVPPPPPNAPDLVAASDSGPSATDNITNDATPDFTVDAGASSAGMTVRIYVDDDDGTADPQVVGSAIVPAGGIATVTTSSLPNDTYVVTATVMNLASEESGQSAGINVEIDTQAPLILTAPSLVDFVGSDPTFTFTQTPRLAVEVDPGSTVSLWEGTTFLGSGVSVDPFGLANGFGIATVTVANPLADGTHVIHATAIDAAGNASAASPTVVITVDSTAPTVTKPDMLAADDDGASSTDDRTKNPRPRFSIATEAGVRVTLFEDGVALGAALADASGTATVRVSDINWLEPGEHCLYVQAIDAVGNSSGESPELCITVLEGIAPFTSNLGVNLGAEFLALKLRSTVPGRAVVRVLHRGKRIKTIRRTLKANKRKAVRVKVSRRVAKRGKVRVVASVKSDDGRRIVIKRTVKRR